MSSDIVASSEPRPARALTRHPKRIWLLRLVCLALSIALSLWLSSFGLLVWDNYLNPPLIQRALIPNTPIITEQYSCSNLKFHEACEPLPHVDPAQWRLYSMDGDATPVPLARLSETPWAFHYQFNEFGLRNDNTSLRPEPGIVRILGLGDSFAFGQGVTDEDTLFQQVSKKLGSKYEIINGAKCGQYTIDELRGAPRLINLYHPQHLLVVWIANDISVNAGLKTELDRLLSERVALEQKSGGLRRLLRGGRWALERDYSRWQADCYDPELNAWGLELFDRTLAKFAALPNCSVAFVLYPMLDRSLSGDYLFADVHRRVADMIRRQGMPVLDLAPAFAGLTASELWVHSGDRHPNARAHQIAALAIANWVRSGVKGFEIKTTAPSGPE